MQTNQPPVDTHYIITVHGMGESKPNQTLLPAINRFSDIELERILGKPKRGRNFVLLGTITGATKSNPNGPWVAFSHIPADPDQPNAYLKFDGKPLTEDESGELMRFADIHWADIFNHDDHLSLIEPLDNWADAVISRTEPSPDARTKKQKKSKWIEHLLYKTQDIIVPIQTALGLFNKKAEELVFTKFLGDVQLYGEYPFLRGLAVQRFHRQMQRIHAGALKKNENPHYTFLTYSLGTIMALDALMYAHAAPKHLMPEKTSKESRKKSKRPEDVNDNFPFHGYDHSSLSDRAPSLDEMNTFYTYKHQLPARDIKEHNARIEEFWLNATDWINYVDHFITLGSPIDKFLALWSNNYKYLNHVDWIRDPGANGNSDKDNGSGSRQNSKIRHYNYFDEQDPVAQSIENLRGKAAYKALFDNEVAPVTEPTPTGETKATTGVADIIYRRAIIPGLAHVTYWLDGGLFKAIRGHIAPTTGKEKSKNQEMHGDKTGSFSKILLVSYLVLPMLAILANTFTFSMAIKAESWQKVFLASGIFLLLAWFSREIINVMIWWRQLLRHQRRSMAKHQKSRDSWVTSNLWGKWIVRLWMPILGIAHFYAFYFISMKLQPARSISATNNQAFLLRIFNEIFEYLKAPFLLAESPLALATALSIAVMGVFIYLIFRSNYKARPIGEFLITLFIDVILVFTTAALVLTAFNGQGPLVLEFFRKITLMEGILYAGIGLVALYLMLISFSKIDKKKFDGWELLNNLAMAIVVLVAGCLLAWGISELLLAIAEYYEKVLATARKQLVMLGNGTADADLLKFGKAAVEKKIAFHSEGLKTMAVYSLVAGIVWLYTSFRFYFAKIQLGMTPLQ